MSRISEFDDLLRFILLSKSHEKAIVDKDFFEHSELQKYKIVLVDPVGQSSDYLIELDDGRSIRVQEYNDHYTIHCGHTYLATKPARHYHKDAPLHVTSGTATLILAYMLSKK